MHLAWGQQLWGRSAGSDFVDPDAAELLAVGGSLAFAGPFSEALLTGVSGSRRHLRGHCA
jgi:hypothetical protein